MKTNILLAVTLFSLTSCSYLKSLVDSDISKHDGFTSKAKTLCLPAKKSQIEIVGSNNYVAEQYTAFFNKFPTNKIKMSFLDKSIIWSLLQMSARPDLAAPQSRLTIIAKINGKKIFIDNYSSDKSAQPYLYALDQLRKRFKGKKTLSQFAKLIDSNYPRHIQVDKGLELFIKENRSQLLKKRQFSKAFFRGKQGLRAGESYKRLRYRPIVANYFKKRPAESYQSDSHLFNVAGSSNKLSCNYDLGIYKHSIYISSDNNKESLPFGLFDEKGNYFIGLASIDYKKITPFNDTFLLSGSSIKAFRPAYCSYSNQGGDFGLISTKGRDPGQLLYRILNKRVPNSKHDIDRQFRDGRMIEFLNPSRIVLESKRSSKQSLGELRRKEFKVYHANEIGNLLGVVESKNSFQSGFVIDDRNRQTIFCK